MNLLGLPPTTPRVEREGAGCLQVFLFVLAFGVAAIVVSERFTIWRWAMSTFSDVPPAWMFPALCGFGFAAAVFGVILLIVSRRSP